MNDRTLSIESQGIGRRITNAVLLIAVFPALAGIGVLIVQGKAIQTSLKNVCLGVIIVSAAAIVLAALKLLRDLVGTFLSTSERIKSIADGNYTRFTTAGTRTPSAPKAEEEKAISTSLDSITDALQGAMSNLKAKTEDLQLANRKLRELDQLKTDFLSSVSHELRTPLSSIRSFSEILLSYEDEDLKTRRRFTRIINDESERLTNLINDLLDISKIEAGRIALKIRQIDPAVIVNTTLETVEPLAAKKAITISFENREIDRHIPGDEARLIQVIINLLSNAVKFSKDGGGIRILIERPLNAEYLSIAVSDDGIGIPKNRMGDIFDKFVQVQERQTGKPRGTGLGLAICREIVHMHSGEIVVESTLGRGSTFSVLLPLQSHAGKETDG